MPMTILASMFAFPSSPYGFSPHSLSSGCCTYNSCISWEQLLQPVRNLFNPLCKSHKQDLAEFKIHRSDRQCNCCGFKRGNNYGKDSVFLDSAPNHEADKSQLFGVEGITSGTFSNMQLKANECDLRMISRGQQFTDLAGRRCFFKLSSICLGTLLTLSAKPASAERDQQSFYDEKRILEQNKRIQKANGAPSDFPNFIREGFNVKVVTSDKYVRCDSGLIYWDIEEGEGDYPKPGQQVLFNYSGYNEAGRRIDSSYQQGAAAKTRIGINGLIPGFEEGIRTMKPGGKRRIIIPPELGPPVGPSTFFSSRQFEVFDVELLSVQDCIRRTFAFYSDIVCN